MIEQNDPNLLPPSNNLQRLLGFLDQDPENLYLLSDAAVAAVDARDPKLALYLLDKYVKLSTQTPAMRNLRGLALLQLAEHHLAAEVFGDLLNDGYADVHVRFNLAWTRAVLGDHRGALELLDDATIASSLRGPSLKIQMLHHLGLLQDALVVGQGLVEAYPDNQALAGSLSTVAMDANEIALAAHYANLGGDSEDALATRGMLSLNDFDAETALGLFSKALALDPDQPRAWVGQGLGLLVQGDVVSAAPCLVKGAELFGRHLGSWIAAGWAHAMAKDPQAARTCFERALAIDDNFGEAHGGLAVIDIIDGRFDSAKRRASIALRLDKHCLSGALAKSLIAEHDKNPALAQKIRDRALTTAIGPRGETLAQAIMKLGMTFRSR